MVLNMLCSLGQKLYGDRYQIIKPIGKGGFTITYLAEDSKKKVSRYSILSRQRNK